jgi:peptidoglycan/xylan/chitin deacetylase (PgdA/CDA1 family)
VSARTRTWAACGVLAAGIVAAAAALGRRRGALAGAGIAAAYLLGTLEPRSRIFGRAARVIPRPGLFALTFDDGPDPRHTPQIAEALASRGHAGTFFVLGRQVRAHPELVAGLIAQGHEVASHGDDHRLLAFASPAAVRAQLRGAEDAVRAATGAPPAPLFRAPHGVRSPWLARTLRGAGYRLVAWDGSVFDTAEPGADEIVARVAGLLEPGRVVLLHDGDGSGLGASRAQTVAALPAILDEAERRGLRSVRLSELLP